jgi:hypothetical protein
LVAGEATVTYVEFSLPEGSARPPGTLMHGAVVEDGVVRIKTSDTMRTLHDLTGWALGSNVELIGLSVHRPSLEDVFIEVTQRDDS